jgi:hypothetical protein
MFYQINYNENGIKIEGHCPKIIFLLFCFRGKLVEQINTSLENITPLNGVS